MPYSIPWPSAFPDRKPADRAPVSCGFAYAIRLALYRIFGSAFANLTTARPVRSKRRNAQVAELVDALASGASGFTAVKVRVLSWAPLAQAPTLRRAIALPIRRRHCRCGDCRNRG